jgi:hypothetical protein
LFQLLYKRLNELRRNVAAGWSRLIQLPQPRYEIQKQAVSLGQYLVGYRPKMACGATAFQADALLTRRLPGNSVSRRPLADRERSN